AILASGWPGLPAGTGARGAGTGRASHGKGPAAQAPDATNVGMVARVCRQREEGAVVQHLTDRQPPLLTATDAGRLGLPRVGHALATFSRRYPVGMGAALVLCMIALLAVLAPMVAPYDPNFQHFNDLQQAPSATYWLGTDYEGRDVLSRLIYGGRVSLTVAVLSVLLGTVVGSA